MSQCFKMSGGGVTGRRSMISTVFAALLACFALSTPVAAEDSPLERAQGYTSSLAARVTPGVVSIRAGRSARGASCSGFIISADGLIVTSTDLVGAAGRSVRVTFKGGVRGRAVVLGRDRISGYALLRVSDRAAVEKKLGARLTAVELGSSQRLLGGHFVFTVGDPFSSLARDGIPALSMGVVTRIGRMTDGQGKYRGKVIETDAAVNNGSFGGPLFDVKGRVVGMVSNTYSKSRWFGSAVPIDLFASIRGLLEKGQAPLGGQLGVVVMDLGGVASSAGVEVLAVKAESPAARRGLKVGDRLRSIDGIKLYDADDLERELSTLPAGTRVRIEVRRGDKEIALSVRLVAGAAPEVVVSAKPATSRPYLGISLKTGEGVGLLVTRLKPGSPFAKLGVKAGDRVLKAAGRRLVGLGDLRRALEGRKVGDTMAFVVSRDGWEKSIDVTLVARPVVARRGIGVTVKAVGEGLVIESVKSGGGAAKSGLKVGDLLLRAKVGDRWQALKAAEDLAEVLSKAEGSVELSVSRDGWGRRLIVPVSSGEGSSAAGPKVMKGRASLGLALRAEDGRFVVDELSAGGPAARAGLKVGDVVLSVDGRALESFDQLGEMLASRRPGQALGLRIERGGWGRNVKVELGASQ